MSLLVKVTCWAIMKRLAGEAIVVTGTPGGFPAFYGKPTKVVGEKADNGKVRFMVLAANPSSGLTARIDFQTLVWNQAAGQWESPGHG